MRSVLVGFFASTKCVSKARLG